MRSRPRLGREGPEGGRQRAGASAEPANERGDRGRARAASARARGSEVAPSASAAPSSDPASTPSAPTSPSSPAAGKPRGLFAVLEWGELPKDATWKNPNVDGVVVRAYWRDLEPKKGAYRWDHFDAALAAAKKHGKRARFIVAPGFYAPDYVLGDPAIKKATFTVPQGPLVGQAKPLPLPWDDAYLGAWLAFVDVVGARYRDEPAFAYISATGPNSHNGEISLPREPADEKAWQAFGTPAEIEQRLLGAWEKTFKRYCTAFRGKHFTLAIISEALPGHDKDERKAYQARLAELGAKTCPQGFGLQNNGLDGRPVQLDLKPLPAWDLIEQYRGKILTGFQSRTRQNLYHCKRSGRACDGEKLDVFRQTLKNALDRGASFIEIYERDLADPELAPLLGEAHQKLVGR